jgi:hypothetical protein
MTTLTLAVIFHPLPQPLPVAYPCSTNKTFLNGEAIEAQRYVELREKDVLKFGTPVSSGWLYGT